MFESILEGLLNKYLGEYVQGLSRDDLSVSIWGGDIELNDLMLRTDLFQKFKLPLQLVHGQIGHLRIQLPWRSLGSKPVIAEVENVWLVVKPLTDQNEWQLAETLETSYEKKEEMIREMARTMFEEMIKTAEEKKKEQGMTSSLITKIVDNLQINLKDIHIRIENQDTLEPENSFSLGITLQEIDLYTTDEHWKRVYLDRTKASNQSLEMHKILQIKNFGMYYKTNERNLISQTEDVNDKQALLATYAKYETEGEKAGCILKHSEDYLISPIQLDVKLTQKEPEQALADKSSFMNLSVGLQNFCITVQKGQYDNVQMLLELTSEYMRFLSHESLKTRKQNLKDMQQLLKENNQPITSNNVRALYQFVFKRQLDIIINGDPKKPEKLQAALIEDLKSQGNFELYQAITLGMNSDDLAHWAKEIVAKEANEKKVDLEMKKQQKSKGFFGRVFGGKEEDQSEEAKNEQIKRIQEEIQERATKMQALSGNSTARANIPDVTFDFTLHEFRLALVNNLGEMKGVMLQVQQLKVLLNQYDATNKYNKKSMDADLKLTQYDLWVSSIDQPELGAPENTTEVKAATNYYPFMQKLIKSDSGESVIGSVMPTEQSMQSKAQSTIPKVAEPDDPNDDQFFDCADEEQKIEPEGEFKPQTHIFVAMGNKEHHESDIVDKDETDLLLELDVQPIEIIYRAETIGDLSRFFKVKKISDKTKLAAQQQYAQLTAQLAEITEGLEQDFKNNKVSIRVAAPTLVIPFQQTTWETIYESECWVFTMGDVSLNSYQVDETVQMTHEAFQLKVERVKFEHASRYYLWKAQITSFQGITSLPSLAYNYSEDGSPSPLLKQMSSQMQVSDVSPDSIEKRVAFEKDAARKNRKLSMIKILEDFTSSVILLKKRAESEMRSDAQRKMLADDTSPAFAIQAEFKDDMQLRLKPAVFQKLCNLGSLFSEGQKPQLYYKKKMLQKLEKAKYHGRVRIIKQLSVQQPGTAALIGPSKLYFWPENAPENKQIFDLFGIEKTGWTVNNLNIFITNSLNKTIELRLENKDQLEQWVLQLVFCAQEIKTIQQEQSQQIEAFESTAEDLPKTTEAAAAQSEVAEFGMNFTVPKICLSLQVNRKKVLSNSKKLDSSSSEDWELTTFLEQIVVNMEQRKHGLHLEAHVSSLQVQDNSSNDRFEFIFRNIPVNDGQQELVTLKLETIDKASPDFQDTETKIELVFSGLEAYWKPQSMVNLLEFINTNQPAKTKKQRQRDDKLERDLKDKIDKGSAAVKHVHQEKQESKQTELQAKHKGCMDKPFFVVKVKISLASVEAFFIHPDNNTYPIFSIKVGTTDVDYWKKSDHDQIMLKVKNLEVFDNTNYFVKTLDPLKQYGKSEEICSKKIVGLNEDREVNGDYMLDMTCYIIEFPLEERCDVQKLFSEDGQTISHDHNICLKMNLQQMQLYFMMEQCLRIVDYSMNFIAHLFTSGDANADYEDSESDDEMMNSQRSYSMASMASEMVSVDIETEAEQDADQWENFDLKQEPFCPKLDLNLHCPLIIMPNLMQPQQRFELDFGTISIKSHPIEEDKRWIHLPDKVFRSMNVLVQNTNLRFDFKDGDEDNKYQTILKEDEVKVNIAVPINSPYFIEFNDRGAQVNNPLLVDGREFDMNLVDTSVQVEIKQSLLKLSLKQDVIIELFNTLEHNVLHKDEFANHFTGILKKRQATIVASKSIQATRKKSTRTKSVAVRAVTTNANDDMMSENESFDGDDHTVLKKKTFQVSIKASCLSIELRKKEGELIAEFCMVNFDYGCQIFANEVMRIYMKAYALFIFHDEEQHPGQQSSTKQVMFGHINAQNQMQTSEEFYKTLPDEIRQKNRYGELGKSKSQKSKEKISFELIMDPNTNKQTISIKMRKLKFFMRPKVFNEISQFTIECLKKLDLKKEKEAAIPEVEEHDPMNDSFVNPDHGTANDTGSTSIINFELLESIFVLERREFQKKAAVVQLGVKVHMKNYDQKALERQFKGAKLRRTGTRNNTWKTVSEMKVEVLGITPYIININDLVSTKFKAAKKRVLIQAFDFTIRMKSRFSPAQAAAIQASNVDSPQLLVGRNERQVAKPVLKFVNSNETVAVMGAIEATVSMDDLYVVQQLANKATEEAVEVGQLWTDYTEQSIVTDSDKLRKIQQDIPNQDSISFVVTNGVDVVVINEEKGTFTPLFLLSAETINYELTSGLNMLDMAEGSVETRCSVHYFNSQKSHWEPAIERFPVKVEIKRVKKQNLQKIILEEPLNINVSVVLGGVIHDFSKLWEKSTKRAQKFQEQIQKSQANIMRDSLIMQRQSLMASRKSLLNQNNVMLMDGDNAQADIVSPYALRNLTDCDIIVCPLDIKLTETNQHANMIIEENKQDTSSKKGCKIKQREMQSLATDFSETLNMSEQDQNGSKRINQKDYFVKIQFDSQSRSPIERFKLNQDKQFVKHDVFSAARPSRSTAEPNLNREFYVVQNKLENQQRVLTIRTQHVLTNNTTNTTYKTQIFFKSKTVVDGKQKSVINVLFKQVIKPGESMPLPDDKDLGITQRMKISIKPEGCRSWSEEFKIDAIKNKLKPDQNIMWSHHKTYSVLRKEATTQPDVFNYLLIPALIIKNCLPLTIRTQLEFHVMTDEERRANRRTEIVTTQQSQETEREIKLVGNFNFERSQQRVWDTFSNESSDTFVGLYLNDTLMPQLIQLVQVTKATDEEREVVFTDAENREFSIYAKIITSIAGTKVLLYAKNVLLCHTEQSIEFFYQKKTDLFDEDNENEFPLPVRDHRNYEQSQGDQTMITERKRIQEPTIWIHKEKNTMCAALVAQLQVKSDLVPINTPGSTGSFEIPQGQHLYQFQCSTATYQPSEKEEAFTRMVEVAPQYIVANLTNQNISFCQAHYQLDQVEFQLPLIQQDRSPFHWSDKDSPKLAKFFVTGAVRASAPFTIADCGSIYVTNQTEDGCTHFFRVTKRMVLNSTFIIIDDMECAPYKIDNLSSEVCIKYHQVQQEIEEQECATESHKPFAWHQVVDSVQMLQVKFFIKVEGRERFLVPQQGEGQSLQYSLDILNRTEKVTLVDPESDTGETYDVFVSAYTDQHSKVFEISDFPSMHIFETDRDKNLGEEENKLGDISLQSSMAMSHRSMVGNGANSKAELQENTTVIEIRQVNISLINKQCEVLTFVLDYWQQQVRTTDNEIILEASLNRLQIDNHGQLEPLFPVILKPKCTTQNAQHNHFGKVMENVSPVMAFYASIKTNIPNVQYINFLEFLIKEIEIKIEIEHLMSIFTFALQFNQSQGAGLTSSHKIFTSQRMLQVEKDLNKSVAGLNDSANISGNRDHLMPVSARSGAKSVRFQEFNKEEHKGGDVREEDPLETMTTNNSDGGDEDDEDELKDQILTWKSNMINEKTDTVYIENFKGSPLCFEISIFKQTRVATKGGEGKTNSKSGNKNQVVELLSNLGLQFTNITGAPMTLNALQIENVYGSRAVVQELLMEHYTSNIRSNVLKFIGSTDLLGNPTDFVNTLGSGARQFYYAPKEGFMEGPLQGGLGLLKGTGSLVSHTLGGVSGSVSKITNTLNRGVLYLSADTEYRQKKEITDIKDKPAGVLDGLGKGVKGFGKSLWSGISGVVMQPVRGAQADGIKGFGKGVGKGILGTVVKPVSGVVDLVSKTTEGIESAVDGGVCKANNQQMRLARPFYKDSGLFGVYNEADAQVYEAIRSTMKQPVQKFASLGDQLYGVFKLSQGVNEDKLDTDVLCLTSGYVFKLVKVLDARKQKQAENLKGSDALNKSHELEYIYKIDELTVPTKNDPNPMLTENFALKILLKEGGLRMELFEDELTAKAAKGCFDDLFFNRND